MISFGVLGPLEARDPQPVPLKGPRHRTLLARLLVARGRVVPVGVLADDMWSGTPPPGAVAAIRTFVADLRRALEPDRPPRAEPRLLVTAAPGYALRAAPDSVDAVRFERLLAAGTLESLDEALALWRGPAYAQWAEQPWARAEIDRLDELHQLAVQRRAAALLERGRPAEAVSDLRPFVAAHPLREESWRLLALALYRSGRQGDALAALREARDTLVSELGVDQGPALRALERDILAQSESLTPPGLAEPSARLFGRDDELARLRGSTASVALVEGEAGAGKSALVEAFAREWAAGGRPVRWGRAGEHEGAPGTWPWTDLRTAADELGPGPVLLVAEDVHRADQDVWDVLAALPGRVRLLATARDTDPGPQYVAFLARLARAEPLRIRLGGLDERATAGLAREVGGRELGAREVRLLRERTGGNPFFVRELARLLATEGPAALRTVPPGVRDVIRHRLAQLPEPTRDVLRRASVLGRDIDPELLAALTALTALAGTAGTDVLDALEEATRAGFLADGTRFAHVLVRDTIYGDLSQPRRAAWHKAAGEAAEALSPGDADVMAYHFTASALRTTAPKAARYSAEAAARAERRNNPHEAARLWRQALDHAPGDAGSLLGLSRALAVTGHLEQSRRLRATAVSMGGLDTFAVPAIWPRNDDEPLSAAIAAAAERALPHASGQARSRLLSTLAMELRGARDARGLEAAEEAYALAGPDPALRALALNARFLHSFATPGRAPARMAIAEELLDLASAHDLVTFAVLGHLIALQSACALDDLPRADEHAAAADALSTRYGLPVVPVFTAWYAALRLAAAGAADEAERAYRAADAVLARSQMPGMHEGLLGLALVSIGRWTPADDLGPYEPWARPLLHRDRRALRDLPPSPHDLLREARLCLALRAARELGDTATHARLSAELRPAANEHAAGSGVLTLGRVADYL
ncbi:BTAD domain-containing putative transcriptional regulator [Dactylosporangium sp. CA-052675]|uniref:BTAD domain-containing putative transcriptional regulator n=1 Tax=Dactylosporangium sp. CA-052675 TaxID=3239927 RepID=UPI003D92F607